MIPYLAIGLFAGIRPLEIQRLTRADISDRYIEIKAAKAKTRKRRLVSLSDNLKAWLALGGDLPLMNKRKRLARLLKLSAAQVAARHHAAQLRKLPLGDAFFSRQDRVRARAPGLQDALCPLPRAGHTRGRAKLLGHQALGPQRNENELEHTCCENFF